MRMSTHHVRMITGRLSPTVAGITTVLLVLCQFSTSTAQLLRFAYVAPTDTMTKYFAKKDLYSLDHKKSNGDSVIVLPGYRIVDLKAPEYVRKFRSIAPENMLKSYDQLVRKTKLSERIDSLLQISGGVVQVQLYLVDDRNGLAGKDPYFTSSLDAKDDQWYVWPAAGNWFWNGKYYGDIGLGERAAVEIRDQPGDWMAWESTMLHEMSHTQFLPDTVYGSTKWDGGVEISYGGDEGHWYGELQADQQSPLDEGLANFWGYMHNEAEAIDMIAWCNRTGHRFKLGSRSLLTGVKEMWNSPHLVDSTVTGLVSDLPEDFLNPNVTPIKGRYERRLYTWLDVPGRYVLHNEIMLTTYFYLFWKYAAGDEDTAMRFIRRAASALAKPVERNRYPAFVANQLAKIMEEYARTPAGRKDEAAGTLRSSMFAYGLLDLVTHLGMKDETIMGQLKIHLQSPPPKAYSAYMKHRAAVKSRLQPYITRNAIDIEKATQELVRYFSTKETILP